MAVNGRDEWRAIVFVLAGFLLALFVLTEPNGTEAANWYIYTFLISIGIILWMRGNQGIKKNWMPHFIYGLFFGGGFILLHTWQPSIFSLGLPRAVESAKYAIVGILAPMGEEFLFRQVIYLSVLRNKYSYLNKKYSVAAATLINSALFTAFHYVAYGFGVQTAAYVGAFTFSIIACWLTEKTGDCIASTGLHMAVNLFLISSPFVAIGA